MLMIIIMTIWKSNHTGLSHCKRVLDLFYQNRRTSAATGKFL